MYGLGPVHPDDRNNPFRYRLETHRSGWARLLLIALAAVIAAGVWFGLGGLNGIIALRDGHKLIYLPYDILFGATVRCMWLSGKIEKRLLPPRQ